MEKKKRTKTFVEEISAIPGGEGIRLCIQCGTCTASCPSADRMEYTPAQLIAMARADMRSEVLSSNAMWCCMSCYLCTARCPRGVKITDLMHALESLAVRERLTSGQTLTPAMYKNFNYFVRNNGRQSEVWFMARYYLSTNPLRAFGLIPVALGLIRHGRLSIKAGKLTPEGVNQLRNILGKAESLGGES